MSIALLLLLFAQDVPLAAAAVPDAELATQRGGFTLPSGVDVALTVQTQTSINGALVLRTVFRADQGPAVLTTFAQRGGETVAVRDGAVTDGGVVAETARGGQLSAALRGNDISITHLAGTAFGTAIANSGSDRTIDTQTNVGIDLHNAGAMLQASAALRVEDVANAAMAMRR